MRTRREIKALAKAAVDQQRGTAVLIFLLILLISIFNLLLVYAIGPLRPSFRLPGMLIVYAVMLVLLVLEVGVIGAFIKIFRGEQTGVGEVFSSLGVNFWRKLGGMLWMGLWVFVWSLLFSFPALSRCSRIP